jgi:diaminohydroxyphosphoribosylaminopyrimidine deaminase / 5-amino-6-(5-phosphoribosylamino)uracil reductase
MAATLRRALAPPAPDLMARALELAEKGRASTHPNPRVGCVIAQGGRIVGQGWHERAGGPHAEIVALQAAGPMARGADVYLTLEPCCHHGRTPPCTDALLAAGVGRVVAAMTDPNPQVAGKGLAALRAAGIATEVGLMEAQAQALNRGFVSRMTRGRPWLTLKLAMTLDGRTALASGESRWITGEEARADVHRLRAEAGAVLTGVDTVLADDPELTVRGAAAPRQPDRIVLDTRLRAEAGARVWRQGARRIAVAAADGRVDLRAALAALGAREVNEVLAECGPRLAGALLQAGVVDEIVAFVAPGLLGHEARALAELPGIATLDQRLKLRFTDARMVGADLRITAVPA